MPAGVARLPIKTIHVNKSPVVFGNLKALGPAAARWRIDLDQAQRHAERAAALGGLLDGLWGEVFARPEPERRPDVDADLYGGFVGDADRARLQQLRALPPDDLAARLPAFDDPRLDELVFRYRARNFQSTLTDDERARWAEHCAARLHDGDGGALTLGAFMARIDELAEAAMQHDDERAQALLEALVDYAETVAPERAR